MGIITSPINSHQNKAPALTYQKLLSLGVLWPAEVDRICAAQTQGHFLVADFLPAKSIAIVAGESGIGKSPFAYQLALSVAAGVPSLGMDVQQGPTLYLDLENPLPESQAMRDRLVRHLGLAKPPDDFLLMTEPPHDLGKPIAEVRPALVVIDSLRSFRPEATKDPPHAAQFLKEIRALAHTYECTFLIIHHLRKPSNDPSPPELDDECRVVNFLLEMEGPRALVNQTDVRIAIVEGDGNPVALKVKWSRRVYGDSPLMLLERVFDNAGEPLGYDLLTGADFLRPEQKAALEKLPPPPKEFSFKDAMGVLGRANDPTNKFLVKCMAHGLVRRVAKGRYQRIPPAFLPPLKPQVAGAGG
jgi:hypothetical protein